jgi:hypothetical protein
MFVLGTISCSILSCATHRDSFDLLSDLNRLNRYAIEEQPVVYEGDNLYEYINGAADLYHDYDFIKVVTETLLIKQHEESIIVDIYDMGKLDNAFGIFSRHRLPGAEYLDIGAECQYSEPTLDMYKGKYFIQLAGSRPFPGLKKELVAVARAIDRQINLAATKPGMFELLPSKGRIPHSEQYIAKDALGFGFLKKVWSADYELEGKPVSLMLICRETKEDAQSIFGKLRKATKDAQDKTDTPADECFAGSDWPDKVVIACRKGKYIIYASGSLDQKKLEQFVLYDVLTN